MSSGSGGGGGATILIWSIMPLHRVCFVTAGHRTIQFLTSDYRCRRIMAVRKNNSAFSIAIVT
jgi:hypothetical protein